MTQNEVPPPEGHDISGLQVSLSVVLAEKALPLERILDLRPGATLDLSKRHDSPLDVYVGETKVSRGRAVDIGERLGVRLEPAPALQPLSTSPKE